MGRVLLSQQTNDRAHQLVEGSDLTPRTEFSLTSPDVIMDRILEARESGWCFVDQEVEIGLKSLAVPLFDSRGRAVAALNTGFAMSDRSRSDSLAEYLPHLLAVQNGLSRTLH